MKINKIGFLSVFATLVLTYSGLSLAGLSVPGLPGGVGGASYKFSDMRKAYQDFDKQEISANYTKLSLGDVESKWKDKYGVKFVETTDAGKLHDDWGRIAFVSPPGSDPKAGNCLKIYYYYTSGFQESGKGPDGSVIRGSVSNTACQTAAEYNTKVQYPPKL